MCYHRWDVRPQFCYLTFARTGHSCLRVKLFSWDSIRQASSRLSFWCCYACRSAGCRLLSTRAKAMNSQPPACPCDRTIKLSYSQRGLRCVAISMLVVYVGWQLCWAGLGQMPPSLFLALTGWPAATTGGTRSVLALLHGNWRLSLVHNAMTLPIVGLVMFTLAWQLVQRRHVLRSPLPLPVVKVWLAVLSLAWIIKLCQALLARYGG